jgi:hypothetical protein
MKYNILLAASVLFQMIGLMTCVVAMAGGEPFASSRRAIWTAVGSLAAGIMCWAAVAIV